MISVMAGILVNIFRMEEQDSFLRVRKIYRRLTYIYTDLAAVYTKLAPAALTVPLPSRTSRTNPAARNGQSAVPETTATSIFSIMNQNNGATASDTPDITLQSHYDSNTPAPLNTQSANQRAVSAPHSASSFLAGSGSASQRSMSMMMDSTRDTGQDSPVITETLGVINEHITEMNTPRSSLLGFPRNKGNDSGSEYSSHVDHRLSYITGNETDEEDSLTMEKVIQWSPAQAAQYLHEIGVEQRHCDVFQEQEISGEVLLNLEKSELFMPELELGPIGRRLATWHKIRAFQEEIKSRKEAPTSSVNGSTNTSIPSINGSSFARAADTAHRSPNLRHSQLNSPQMTGDERPGMLRMQSNDSAPRPSAAAARDLVHSRRHSSMDYTKQDRATPPISPNTQYPGHRPQGSFDRNWTMNSVPTTQSAARPGRASTALGFGALGMASPGMPQIADRRVMTEGAANLNVRSTNLAELDRGYLSSGEAEGNTRGKLRNLLRKSQPNSAAHSRQSSGNTDSRSILSTGPAAAKRHSRFGSAGSIFGALDRQLEFHPTLGHQTKPPSPPLSRTESRALSRGETNFTRVRSISLRESSSSNSQSTAATLAGGGNVMASSDISHATNLAVPSPPLSGAKDATPIVTKLDYTGSPSTLATKSNPVSPLTKPESFSAFSRMTSSLRTGGKRSSSEAVTNIDKSQISAPIVPSTVTEAPLQSPARTGSTTPSAASKSMEMDTTPDTSIKEGAAAAVGSRAVSSSTTNTTNKRSKNKKDTSAYRSLQVISPEQATEDCAQSGWMHKKSAKMTSTFKSRYFVLKDKRLSYFYSLDDKIEKGLIDINAHRVEQVENDLMTSLYATLAGAKSSPASPTNPYPSGTTTPNGGYSQGSPFFFKLVPPKAGLSKAVQFTKPAIHYFAVDNYEDGREWFLALKKASIDRDESQPITSTYSQKTISLAKAQQQRQRPPALMNPEDFSKPQKEPVKVTEKTSSMDGDGLAIGGLNLSYEHIPSSIDDTSINGVPDINLVESPHTGNAESAAESTSNTQRPQSEQQSGAPSARQVSPSTLRLVRSLSGGLRQHTDIMEETTAATEG